MGRPKGSKNKKTVAPYSKQDWTNKAEALQSSVSRYTLRSRVEKDALDADVMYYFIHDLNRGAIYSEIIARFTVETEAKLCVEFLNGIRKISKKEYHKKRLCLPQE